MINWYEKLRLNLKYKVWPKIARNWFYIFLPVVMMCSFNVVDNNLGELKHPVCQKETDRPDCYIFYGIAQNDLKASSKKDILKINYLVEGFPTAEHDVFVEIIDEEGNLDFLYSEKHSGSHRAHNLSHQKQRQYKASYKIPAKKLGKGKWKLRVTFRFHLPLGFTKLVSNDVKFEIK